MLRYSSIIVCITFAQYCIPPVKVVFNPYTIGKSHLIKGTFEYFLCFTRCRGSYGLSIQMVRTDRKIASHLGDLQFFLRFTGVKGVTGCRSVRSVRME